MTPSVEIAQAIGNPVLILFYVVIMGLIGIIFALLGKIHLDGKVMRILAGGFAKQGEAIDNIRRLLYTQITRGHGNVD